MENPFKRRHDDSIKSITLRYIHPVLIGFFIIISVIALVITVNYFGIFYSDLIQEKLSKIELQLEANSLEQESVVREIKSLKAEHEYLQNKIKARLELAKNKMKDLSKDVENFQKSRSELN